MSFLCLYCDKALALRTTPHVCTVHHGFDGIVEKKDLAALSVAIAHDKTYKTTDINPSCRKVAFDCIINTTKREIYIIVQANIDFTVNLHFGGWTTMTKNTARTAIECAPGLWDRHITLRRTISTSAFQDFVPIFFLNSNASWFNKRFNIEVETAQAAVALDDGTMTVMASAFVPTGTGYVPMSLPGSGTHHYHKMKVNRYSARLVPANINQVACEVMNPMAHEYGHMLGIPDEYLAIPTSWKACADDRDKAGYLWNKRLAAEGMVTKNDYDMNYRNGLMSASIDARPTGFKRQYYVTVLEAVRVVCQRNSLTGTWSIP